MNKRIKNEIIKIAQSSPNEEVCGFIAFNGNDVEVIRVENTAADKKDFFDINWVDYVDISSKNRILGIFHSHVNTSSEFSNDDVSLADEILIPIYVYSLVDEKMNCYIPRGIELQSFEGREFIWGFNDCYSLVRDFYKTKGVLLEDFERDETPLKQNYQIFVKLAEQIGFRKIDLSEVKEGDLIVVNTGKRKHLLIYKKNGMILHQPSNGISRTEEIGDYSTKIETILRYER
jgi:proteasome lid subunit RPN8/RPN11